MTYAAAFKPQSRYLDNPQQRPKMPLDMTKQTTICLLSALAFLSSACTVGTDDSAREPGPLPDDANKVTYWKVVGSSSSSTGCTDSADWAEATSAPSFGNNSYLMYKVVDGAKATMQSCPTTSASSCTDSTDGAEWIINGHTLTYTDDPHIIDGDAKCNYAMSPVWTLIDNGDTADWSIEMPFAADPAKQDCDAFGQAIKDNSSNGHGLLGCSVKLDVDLDFEKTEAP